MPAIAARGAASVTAMGNSDGESVRFHMNTSTPAGWAMIYWWLSVLIIGFFIWAL